MFSHIHKFNLISLLLLFQTLTLMLTSVRLLALSVMKMLTAKTLVDLIFAPAN